MSSYAFGLSFLLVVVLLGVAGAALDLARPFFVHGVFAAAALPLMWAALLHFVPVLTRSGAPASGLRALPWLALVLSLVLLAALAGCLPRRVLLVVALGIAGAAAVMIGWLWRRGKRAIGAPHPGLHWYLAALSILLAAMAAVAGMLLDPGRYARWYALHLHLNLFGWVGLTVLGTLPVLLPTTMQKFEPNAAWRLRAGLPWAIFGVLAIALGAGLKQADLGALGGLVLITLVALHWRAWLGFYGSARHWPGPAVSLLCGSGFLLLLLAAGVAHGFGLIAGATLLPAFGAGFLLPTVLGALAQLLPVWRFPGPDSSLRQAYARRLASGAGWRGLLAAGGGAASLVGWLPGLGAAGVAAGWLLVLAILPPVEKRNAA